MIITTDANKNMGRFRKLNELNEKLYSVASATVIYIGAGLFFDLSTGTVKPAKDFTWDTNEAITQEKFSRYFVGVAKHASKAGETKDILVVRNGVHEYDIYAAAAATLKIGTLVNFAKNSGANTLLDQVMKNAACDYGIGRLAKPCLTTDVTMMVAIEGKFIEKRQEVAYFGSVDAGTGDERCIFVAPHDCYISRVYLLNAGNLAAHADNYTTLTITNKGLAGSGTTKLWEKETDSDTDNFSLTAFVAKKLELTAANCGMSLGEVLTLKKTDAGAGVATDELQVIIEYYTIQY